MRKFTVFLLAILMLLSGILPRHAHAATTPSHVRVLLSTGEKNRVTFSLTGAYCAGGTEVSGGTVTFEKRGKRIAITHSESGLLAENELVYLTRVGGERFEAFLTFENARYGKCSYQGDLMGCLDADGTLQIINYVPLRDYLYSVTGSELPNVKNAEALKAEAITAKGYVLGCMNDDRDFDVVDTPRDQVYKGYRPGVSPATEAVDAVFDLTLTMDGEPIKCYYCTSNGGQTLTPAMCWGSSRSSAAYEMTFDPFDVAGSEHSAVLPIDRAPAAWSDALYAFLLDLVRQQVDADALVSLDALKGYHHAEKLSGSDLLPDARAPQAYAEAMLTVRTASGGETAVTVGFAPKTLAENGIVDCPDADVYFIRETDNGFEAVFGVADGHRVGMSHRGLIEMARQGYSYREILAFYYPNAALTRDNGLQDPAPLPEPTPYSLEVVAVDASPAPSDWATLFGLLP